MQQDEGTGARRAQGTGTRDRADRRTTVFLVDDHEIVRRSLRDLLDGEEDLEVIGDAATCTSALEQLETLHPDVAVLDVRLPDGSGLELCRQIRTAHPDTECVMLSFLADEDSRARARRAGAAGFVVKQVRGNDLLDGVRRAGQHRRD